MRPPAATLPYVLQFAKQVVPRGDEPIYLPCDPDPAAAPSECFASVAAVVKRSGGRAVIGWAIWEWPRVYIEAEFHAVWQRPDGRLIDVAARPVALPRILFLRDSTRRYVGYQVNNVRRPLRRDGEVARFLFLADELFRTTNEGANRYLSEVLATPEMIAMGVEQEVLRRSLLRRFGEPGTELDIDRRGHG